MVWRSKRLDARIATEFAGLQGHDKGPLPYFVDAMHPPIYDGGVRVEGPLETCDSEEEENESEEGSKPEEGNQPEEEHNSEEVHELVGMDTPSKGRDGE